MTCISNHITHTRNGIGCLHVSPIYIKEISFSSQSPVKELQTCSNFIVPAVFWVVSSFGISLEYGVETSWFISASDTDIVEIVFICKVLKCELRSKLAEVGTANKVLCMCRNTC